MNLARVMQRLYDSEINVSISSMWDGGWDVKLGDEMNGFVAEASFHPSNGTSPDTFDHARSWLTLEDAAVWLDRAARDHYPESKYAKRLFCCFIEPGPVVSVSFGPGSPCDETAEYVIHGRVGSIEDYTHACSKHVGDLLSDAEGIQRESMFKVMPICGVCGNDSPEMHPDPHCAGCSPWVVSV